MGRSAFTLIEVIVAVVILFGGVIAVVRCYSLAVEAMSVARERLEADAILNAQMGEMELALLTAGRARNGGGTVPAGDRTYGWDLRVAPRGGGDSLELSIVTGQAWRAGRGAREPQALVTWIREQSP